MCAPVEVNLQLSPALPRSQRDRSRMTIKNQRNQGSRSTRAIPGGDEAS
jgi:hypothetical protein